MKQFFPAKKIIMFSWISVKEVVDKYNVKIGERGDLSFT